MEAALDALDGSSSDEGTVANAESGVRIENALDGLQSSSEEGT